MTPRFQILMCLGLSLAACDKPEQSNARPDDGGSAPKVTRANRPHESPPEPRENLRASLKSAREIAAPEEREKAVAEVAWNAIELDPDLAREAFDQLTADGADRIRLIRHFAMRLAEGNPEDAIKWAKALGTANETAAALGQIALVIADADPRRAADLLSESGVAGRGFDVAVVQVLQRWAAKSAPDAAAWVVMFPAGKSREAGIKTVVSQWVETDAGAAFSWMAALQDEAVRKETALAMAAALLQQPQDVRDAWLQHADSRTRGEIEQQNDRARKEAGAE